MLALKELASGAVPNVRREAAPTLRAPNPPAPGISLVRGWCTPPISANPHANGTVQRELVLPDFPHHAVEVRKPGTTFGEATRVLGEYLREVLRLNAEARKIRIFGPDETASQRLSPVT